MIFYRREAHVLINEIRYFIMKSAKYGLAAQRPEITQYVATFCIRIRFHRGSFRKVLIKTYTVRYKSQNTPGTSPVKIRYTLLKKGQTRAVAFFIMETGCSEAVSSLCYRKDANTINTSSSMGFLTGECTVKVFSPGHFLLGRNSTEHSDRMKEGVQL